MKKSLEKVHAHVRKHKKHYHIGVLGTLVTIWGIMMYPNIVSLFADEVNTGEVLTGDTVIGIVDTGVVVVVDTGTTNTGEILTGSENTGTIQLLSETGSNLSGENLSGENNTGTIMLTSIQSGSNDTGSINTGVVNTGVINTGTITITGFSMTVTPIVSGYVGLSGVVEIKFTSDKILTGIISSIYGTKADEVINSGFDYTLKLLLTKYNLHNSQTYAITFKDGEGNSGNLVGTGPAIFDKIGPAFNAISFSGNYNTIDIFGTTNENSLFKIIYTNSGGATVSGSTNTYTTGFSYTITGLNSGSIYTFAISFSDILNNISLYSGNFYFDQSGGIKLNYVIASGYQEVATGSDNIFLLQEIKKLNDCKEGVEFTDIKLPLEGKDMYMKLPKFTDDATRKVVSEISYDIVTKMQKKNISDAMIEELFKRYNNFMLIIKLVKDDNNACEQNFSQYYIARFQRAIVDILSD